MQNIKDSNFNELSKAASNVYQLSPWLDNKSVNSLSEIRQQIELVSLRFQQSNKWVLVVSADAKAVRQYQQSTADTKVLWVHSDKVNVAQSNIEQTLLKGNCAAIVLCNASLNSTQVSQIEHCATIGKTHCLLLTQTNRLH